MANFGDNMKTAFLKGLEALGKGASSLTNAAQHKINEMNLDSRRREILSEIPKCVMEMWKNGVELYNETYSLPQTLAVSHVVPGDVIEVHLTCKPDEKGSITLHTGILDEALFRKGYDILSKSPLELTAFSNTRVEGTVTCVREQLLYTSIPQDGNWQATVNGEPAQIVCIGDAMVGLLLPEGTHNVSFTYRNKAFSLGWKVTLACAFVFSAIYLCIYHPQRKRGKYEKF